jgi:hypothetical protein
MIEVASLFVYGVLLIGLVLTALNLPKLRGPTTRTMMVMVVLLAAWMGGLMAVARREVNLSAEPAVTFLAFQAIPVLAAGLYISRPWDGWLIAAWLPLSSVALVVQVALAD